MSGLSTGNTNTENRRVGNDLLWFRSLQLIPPLIAKRTFSGCLWEGPPDCGMLAFTFDDGPDPDVTPAVLDALDRAGAPGTFFLRGDRVRAHGAIVREIIARGHAVGNHGMNHQRMFFMGREVIAREIDAARDVIADAAGVSPRFFRPPYGHFNSAVSRAARDRGLVLTIWTLLSGDFRTAESRNGVRTVEPFIRAGAIIVFHDTLKGNGTMVPGLIERFSIPCPRTRLRPALSRPSRRLPKGERPNYDPVRGGCRLYAVIYIRMLSCSRRGCASGEKHPLPDELPPQSRWLSAPGMRRAHHPLSHRHAGA